MKKIFLFLILNISVLLYGESLDSLIQKIKKAPSSQKRELINKLKLKLRNTNKKHRLSIIKQLKHQKNRLSIHYKSDMIHKVPVKQITHQIKAIKSSKSAHTHKDKHIKKGKH